ncbi:hypothetical protein GGP41_000676 [Bipolaris sorokiniana]|uniref:Uncharacterized protein n=1 Tax=Cochliobolus sativus TaxID=45130 RepID=A0A8H6DXT8_COCSA|nr:hypothetical protein GGP41_000676 [Bipolaris sorokiniana]
MVKSVSQPASTWGVAVYYNAAPGLMSRPALGTPLAMLRLALPWGHAIASRKPPPPLHMSMLHVASVTAPTKHPVQSRPPAATWSFETWGSIASDRIIPLSRHDLRGPASEPERHFATHSESTPPSWPQMEHTATEGTRPAPRHAQHPTRPVFGLTSPLRQPDPDLSTSRHQVLVALGGHHGMTAHPPHCSWLMEGLPGGPSKLGSGHGACVARLTIFCPM